MVAWIGMRGGLSLAASLALPFTLTGGTPFPQRDLVIFFTFGVILVTLVGQGLSLGPIIRLLGLEQDGALEQEHAKAHLVAARAALSRLDELATEAWVPQDALAQLRSHYEKKLEALTPSVDGAGDERAVVHAPVQQRLQQEVLQAERAAVIGLRGLRCCTIHLHEHALAHALSGRALPCGRNTPAWGCWGISRHCDDRRPAPLALSCSGSCWWLSAG